MIVGSGDRTGRGHVAGTPSVFDVSPFLLFFLFIDTMQLGNWTRALAFFHGLRDKAHNTLNFLTQDTVSIVAPSPDHLALVYPLWGVQDPSEPTQWHLRVHGVVLSPRTRKNPPTWWQKASFGFVEQMWVLGDREKEDRVRERMRIAFSEPQPLATIDALGFDGLAGDEHVQDGFNHVSQRAMFDNTSLSANTTSSSSSSSSTTTTTTTTSDDDDQDTLDKEVQWIPLAAADTLYPPPKTSDQGVFDLSGLPFTQVTLPERFTPGTSLSLALRVNGSSPMYRTTLQLVGRHGYSIISDVDDTVKDTRVLQKREALKRTLVGEYTPIQGMPQLYHLLEKKLQLPDTTRFPVQSELPSSQDDAIPETQSKIKTWARGFWGRIGSLFKSKPDTPTAVLAPQHPQPEAPLSDVQFHFLSASSFDLLPPLTQFIRKFFPSTSSLLPSPKRIQNLGGQLILDLRSYKSNGTRWIAHQFPKRKFLLFGDSGQYDPEGYGDVARDEQNRLRQGYSANNTENEQDGMLPVYLQERQFRCVLIRLVQGQDAKTEKEKNNEPRFRSAFRQVHPLTWRVFSDPKELETVPFDQGVCYGPNEKNVWQERIRRWEQLQEQLRQEAEARRVEADRAAQAAIQARKAYKQAKRQQRQALRLADRVRTQVPDVVRKPNEDEESLVAI